MRQKKSRFNISLIIYTFGLTNKLVTNPSKNGTLFLKAAIIKITYWVFMLSLLPSCKSTKVSVLMTEIVKVSQIPFLARLIDPLYCLVCMFLLFSQLASHIHAVTHWLIRAAHPGPDMCES